MFNRLKLRGYSIPCFKSIKPQDEKLVEMLTSLYYLSGYIKSDSPKFAAVTEYVRTCIETNNVKPWIPTTVRRINVSQSIFTETCIDDSKCTTCAVQKVELKDEDADHNSDDESVETHTVEVRLATDDFVEVQNDNFYYGFCKENKTENAEEYSALQIRLAGALQTMLLIGGVDYADHNYRWLATTDGGLKTSKHYFCLPALLDEKHFMMDEKLRLGRLTNADLGKFISRCAKSMTDSAPIKTTDDFLSKVVVLDPESEIYQKLSKVGVTTRAIFFDPITKKMTREAKVGTYCNNPSDGAMWINSRKAPGYDGNMIQGRLGQGVKGMAQVVDFVALANFVGADEHYKVKDYLSGKEFEIGEISMILTKDTFKEINEAKEGGFKSFEEYTKHFGVDFVSAKAVYANHVTLGETISYTKQMLSVQVLTPEMAQYIASIDLEKMKTVAGVGMTDEARHAARVDFAKQCLGDQAVGKMLTVDNGNFVYSNFCSKKVHEGYLSMFRDAQQKWQVKGHTLIAFPDIVKTFAVILGVEHEGLCGEKDDGVYCMSLPNGEVMINRNPVLANDTCIQHNHYYADNPANKFCNAAVCYFGFSSTAPKSLNCDFDGDKVNVSADSKLIKMVKNTNATIDMPMICYEDLHGKEHMPLPELKEDFTGSYSQIGNALAAARVYASYVGISAAIISQIARYINSLVYVKKDYKKASEVFLRDLAPMAQQEQIAVDSAKRLSFYLWDRSDSVMAQLDTKFYADPKAMVNKYFKALVDRKDGVLLYGCDLGNTKVEVDNNGYAKLKGGCDNMELMFNVFAEAVPMHLFWYVNEKEEVKPTLELVKMQEEYPYDPKGLFWTSPSDGDYKIIIPEAAKVILRKYFKVEIEYTDSRGETNSRRVIPASSYEYLKAGVMDKKYVVEILRNMTAVECFNGKKADLRALYRALKEVNPELYAKLSSCIECKQNSISLYWFCEMSMRDDDGMSDPVLYVQSTLEPET